jgi:hypothetical protein
MENENWRASSTTRIYLSSIVVTDQLLLMYIYSGRSVAGRLLEERSACLAPRSQVLRWATDELRRRGADVSRSAIGWLHV